MDRGKGQLRCEAQKGSLLEEEGWVDCSSPPVHPLRHDLHPHLEALAAFRTRERLLASPLYQEIRGRIEATLASLEWGRGRKLLPSRNRGFVRALFWNIERGKAFCAIRNLLLHHPLLSRVDLLLLNEVDLGMGRSGNRNVAAALADALGMYYCFVPSFFVLCPGEVGERDHGLPNEEALYGDAILSRFPILGARNVSLPRIRDYFETAEPRIGHQRGVIVRILLPDGPIDVATTHLEIFASSMERARQLHVLLEQLEALRCDRKLVGGDFNTCTYNLKNKFLLAWSLLHKFLRLGIEGTIAHYMTPERIFERPVFEVLERFGYEVDRYNDRSKGTCYYDMTDPVVLEKSRMHVPDFVLRWLAKKLEPWGGVVQNRIDWFAARGVEPAAPSGEALSPQVIERPTWQGRRASDHNPLLLDLAVGG